MSDDDLVPTPRSGRSAITHPPAPELAKLLLKTLHDLEDIAVADGDTVDRLGIGRLRGDLSSQDMATLARMLHMLLRELRRTTRRDEPPRVVALAPRSRFRPRLTRR